MRTIRQLRAPRDCVDTAEQFHVELDNAERLSWLFSRSRERKARRMDALAVALLMILMALFGCILVMLSAPHAKADPDSMVYAYAATFGGAVCETLDEYPSFAGIYGIGDAIAEDGLTYHQAGQVIAIAAMEICPRHLALVKSFANATAGATA